MGLALTDEHVALAATARRWLETRTPVAAARAVAGDDRRCEARAGGPSWPASVGSACAVAEEHGGQGYGVAELAVVLEQAGRVDARRTVPAHGDRRRRPSPDGRPTRCPRARLVDGTCTAGFALESDLTSARCRPSRAPAAGWSCPARCPPCGPARSPICCSCRSRWVASRSGA